MERRANVPMTPKKTHTGNVAALLVPNEVRGSRRINLKDTFV